MSQGARRQAIHLPHARSRIKENEDAAARWRKIIDEKQSASQEQGRGTRVTGPGNDKLARKRTARHHGGGAVSYNDPLEPHQSSLT